MAQRICFQLQVDPITSRNMYAATKPCGRRCEKRSRPRLAQLLLVHDDVRGCRRLLECEDFEEARRAMEQTEVNARWQAEMAPLFEGLAGARPDEQMAPLPEIFHLD